MTQDLPELDHERFLRLTFALAERSRREGNHPFAAILVGPDGEVAMEAMNAFGVEGDSTGHAERTLMTRASIAYGADFLGGCTMYANAEPCAMCAGAAYWAGIGRVVHGMSEKALKALIGPPPRKPYPRSPMPRGIRRRTAEGGGRRAVAGGGVRQGPRGVLVGVAPRQSIECRGYPT